MPSNDEQIVQTIAEVARRHLRWTGELSRDTRLVETLALDSLRLLTLLVEIEDRFEVRLDGEREASIATVGDLVDAIRRARAEQPADAR